MTAVEYRAIRSAGSPSASRTRGSVEGFTLIEVLIAVFVLVVGMFGGAMLMLTTVRTNREAVVHTQAVLVAKSMMDRMSANLVGVWGEAYNGQYDGAVTGGAKFTDCNDQASCDPTALAARDVQQWRMEIAQSLSAGAVGAVSCSPRTPAPSGAALTKAPVYDGYCEITLAWDEQRTDGKVDAQNVKWRFVP